jgi:hypothetical protein
VSVTREEKRVVRNRLKGAALAAVGLAVVWCSVVPTMGQAPNAKLFSPYKAPRTQDDKPDLSGIWQSFTTANLDIRAHSAAPGPLPAMLGAWGAERGGRSIIDGGEIPYQPWAVQKQQENYKNRLTVKVTNDPSRYDVGDRELQCYRPGVPRANYMPYPFQIFQTPEEILIVYEFKGAVRSIHMGSTEEAPGDTWMGWSNGKWDGETLVVDVTGFNGNNWFDRAGNFHSNALRVVERWTAISPYHMRYEATIEDPKVFTRPWKIQFPLYRLIEENVQLIEFNCVPFVEEMMYGPLGLYKSQPRQAK